MDSVTIEKAKLLEILRENRKVHHETAKAANVAYREAATAKLKAALKQVQKGGDIIQALGLVIPQDYTRQYDTVIKMLELSTNTHVDLTQAQFVQFVEDEWTWKNNFVASTQMYR